MPPLKAQGGAARSRRDGPGTYVFWQPAGRVAEWLKAPDSKSDVVARLPWVQIPPLPPSIHPVPLRTALPAGGPNANLQRGAVDPITDCGANRGAAVRWAMRCRSSGGSFDVVNPAQMDGNGLGARADVKFFVDVPEVGVDGVVTDFQHLDDFRVSVSLRQVVEPLLFAQGWFFISGAPTWVGSWAPVRRSRLKSAFRFGTTFLAIVPTSRKRHAIRAGGC
jgi:hypothetical protein